MKWKYHQGIKKMSKIINVHFNFWRRVSPIFQSIHYSQTVRSPNLGLKFSRQMKCEIQIFLGEVLPAGTDYQLLILFFKETYTELCIRYINLTIGLNLN